MSTHLTRVSHFITPDDEIRYIEGWIKAGVVNLTTDVDCDLAERWSIAVKLRDAAAAMMDELEDAMKRAEREECAYAPCAHTLCAEFGPRSCDKR